MKYLKLILPLFMLSSLAYSLPRIALRNLEWPADADFMSKKVNNIDLRGSLIRSGKFQIVEMPVGFTVTRNSETSDNHNLSESAAIQDGVEYVLVGMVQSANWFENSAPSQDSSYTIAYKKNEVLISYKLVRVKDKVSVAAFTVNATGKQTVTLAPGQSLHLNVGQIIQDTSKDLAKKVTEELLEQYSNAAPKELNTDKHLVTDFQTYD